MPYLLYVLYLRPTFRVHSDSGSESHSRGPGPTVFLSAVCALNRA